MSDLKNKLMEKIESKEVHKRSRSFFIFVKALVEVALFSLLVLAVYLINLSFYLPKRDFRPTVGAHRLTVIAGIVPWHYLIIGALGLGIAFWLMYRFTGTYKKHFIVVAVVISLTVLAVSLTLAFSNFNERIQERPNLRGLYRMNQDGPGPRDGSGPGFRNLK